ncbi:MAG: hypothetical protein WED01_08310 [Candidatus Rokuibacteriota bacterium]
MIAARGCVLGIDVGYSADDRTTGLCALAWDDDVLTWQTAVTGTASGLRTAALRQLLEKVDHVDGVAIDGPLRPGLVCVPEYRCAESLLARGVFQRRGKPGASHYGFGWDLHRAATAMAKLVVRITGVRRDAVVEAFPNGFLAVLHDEAGFPRSADVQRRWTDVLYARPCVRTALERLLADVAPGRTMTGDWDFAGSPQSDLHDVRAALVCALTALCVAAHRCVAVGAPTDGFIHLPPRSAWGRGAGDGAPWAEVALRKNVDAVCSDRVRGWSPAVHSDGSRWLPA